MMMSRRNGNAIDREQHIIQSVVDILTTAKGERLMQPDYGIDLSLLDASMSQTTALRALAVIRRALAIEDRIEVQQVKIVEADSDGGLVVQIGAIDREGRKSLIMDDLRLLA